MIILVVGGSKSKKSDISEVIAEKLHKEGELYYLATMKASDKDDKIRILNHINSRAGKGYTTIECYKNIGEVISRIKSNDTLLLDSITSLATNEMFQGNIINEDINTKITNEITQISKGIKNLVIVTDFISCDGIVYDDYTNIFRRELGKINCKLAELAHIVIESSFGNSTIHKGKERICNEEFINSL